MVAKYTRRAEDAGWLSVRTGCRGRPGSGSVRWSSTRDHAPRPRCRDARHSVPATPAGCADCLAALHRKPAHLDYVGCAPQPERQGKPLRATYRVTGRFAAMVETALRRSTGLAPLRRSCCQWDAPSKSFRDAAGHDFRITMVSDAATAPTRADWLRIGHFTVIVERLTDDI